MSSLDKLFANSLKNDITHSFVESVEAIIFLEGISSDDFLISHNVKVYTPVIKNDFSFYQPQKLTFTQDYEYIDTTYDILGIWLYKLSENFRRIYSAHKKNNDISSLLQQQHNLYTISNYFLDHWTTNNQPTFFPRAVFGRHCDYLTPVDYLIYLGTHNSLSHENFDHHLKLLVTLLPHLEKSDFPDFLPKLALSSKNSKLLKTIIPYFSSDTLINSLKYGQSSDGFNILSFEYLFENPDKFILADYEKIDLIKKILREDILLSKHFDDFILDKSVYLHKISQFITPEVSKEIEPLFINKSNKNSFYQQVQSSFLINKKKSNPYALSKEILSLSFDELHASYLLSPEIVDDTIQIFVGNSSLKENYSNKDYLFKNLKNMVEKLHPVMTKSHLAHIISLNNDFISFCKPLYLHIKLNEKFQHSQDSLVSKSQDSHCLNILNIPSEKINTPEKKNKI